jgi:cyclic pyranopterin phosphate synthase
MKTNMADVSSKPLVQRTAVAVGTLVLKPGTVKAVKDGKIKKGDVLSIASTAGIQAAKSTWSIIPLCHQVPLTHIDVDFTIGRDYVTCTSTVSAHYKTGVEMEALVCASVALLAVWDMVKYLEKDVNGQYPTTRLEMLRVVSKIKGEKNKSVFCREEKS